MKKRDVYKQSLKIFEELHNKYPSYELGRHIATAFADYGDIWGLTGKEFLFALQKYASELELDSDHVVSDEYVKNITDDAADLFTDKTTEDEWDNE